MTDAASGEYRHHRGVAGDRQHRCDPGGQGGRGAVEFGVAQGAAGGVEQRRMVRVGGGGRDEQIGHRARLVVESRRTGLTLAQSVSLVGGDEAGGVDGGVGCLGDRGQ